MQLSFDPNQDFQLGAIGAVAGLLEGQPRNELDLSFALAPFAAIANRLDLDEETLLANLRAVQRANGLPPDPALACIEQRVETAEGAKQARFPNFSVEMETGTGKTYVYLRSALELYRRYGLRKFIVVVPSVAVREGVLKTLSITQQHLRDLYDNAPYRYYVYDSDNLSRMRQFALSDSVEIMVMTLDSFNKASNVIRQDTDRLQGEVPLHLIQAARPILILDEPQNMESEIAVRALADLDPLLALRYSATHRNPYNLVYRLTPLDAYRQRLVKHIEVASVLKDTDANQVFLRLDGIDVGPGRPTARLALHKRMANGTVKETVMRVRHGDALAEETGRPEYAGFVVTEISAIGRYVRFANTVEIEEGEARGADKEAIFTAQIRYTIEEHFYKQARLKKAGIKVLSLFFIDRVDNYAPQDGLLRQLFLREFNSLQTRFPDWAEVDPAQVQAAYFASRRRKDGHIELLDSVSGKAKEDEAAYDLIMRDKERLLSFDEPVAFIFSHSALREGWDNPNVCQICTLNQSASEIKKRQEIGRGVRLCVDQTGQRVRDDRYNILTVVANESYERYVAQLQSEMVEAYGTEGVAPPPPSARTRATARVRQEYMLRPEFQQLWDQIKHKTRYAVTIDTAALLAAATAALDDATIRPPRVMVRKAGVGISATGALEAQPASGGEALIDLSGRYALPNIVGLMAELMEQTTPPVRLTRDTLAALYRRTANKAAALTNPQEFALAATRILKETLADQLVRGIQYEKINDWYEMTQLDEIEAWEEYLVPAEHSIYDYVVCDSEVERDFVRDLEKRGNIVLYIKLPHWFTVPTPVGEYNPDWAIVLEQRRHDQVERLLYLVRETKSTTESGDLRPDEWRKTECGRRHFRDALGVDYAVVSSVAELP